MLELDDLIAVGDGLLCGRHPLATTQEVASAVVEYAGRSGSRQLREAVLCMRPRVESRRVIFLRLLIVSSGFPEPQTNCEIPLAAGTRRVCGDLIYFQYGVLVEYDGEQHRRNDLQYNRDIERLHDLHDLRAASWIVITVRKDSTREWVRNAIEVALRSGAGAPDSDPPSTARGPRLPALVVGDCREWPHRRCEWARMARLPRVKRPRVTTRSGQPATDRCQRRTG